MSFNAFVVIRWTSRGSRVASSGVVTGSPSLERASVAIIVLMYRADFLPCVSHHDFSFC